MSEEIEARSTILEELGNTVIASNEKMAAVKQANSAFGLLSSIPMICRASDCPYSGVCPVYQGEFCRPGERCPIELDLVRNMFSSYCIELGINPDFDKIQAGLIKDLVSVEIQAIRANKVLSFGDFIVKVVDSINQRTGEVYYKDDIHVAMVWTERLLNQKIRILDTLAATPLIKMRYLGESKKDSLLDKISSLKKQVESLLPKVEEEETYDISSDW